MVAVGWFLNNAWLIPVLPSVAFAVIILFGKRLPMKGSEVGLASMGLSLVLAVGAAVQWIQRTNDVAGADEHAGPIGWMGAAVRSVAAAEGGHAEPFVQPVVRQWVWWSNGGFELTIGQHIDGLSVMLLLLVTFISLLVQIFSLEYVRGDRRYTHFFAAITLFSAGMLVMVLAENTVQLILGWEIMGLCSFLLIGHWWEEEANARAALKAFLTVRVGDVGLLVGVVVLYFGANDWARENMNSSGFSIRAISAWALSGEGSHSVLLWGSVALFIAAIGKSGQFPLHTWLPDAMAGPTPVSSLLHSSTMVVGGVFLVARLYPVFWEGFSIPDVSVNFIVLIAGITIIISGLLAFVQTDIKKVLAYSTVGQLGYMMLGLGAGAWLPAVFHIFTHAFFKCCLFLCAGSVSHSGSHHSFDMKADMGGLAKKMPITATAWIVSSLALVGMFPFAGFFSKDEIIDNVGHNGYSTFMWIGLIGAALTAAYTVRATYLTFFGEARGAAAVHGSDLEAAGAASVRIGSSPLTDAAGPGVASRSGSIPSGEVAHAPLPTGADHDLDVPRQDDAGLHEPELEPGVVLTASGLPTGVEGSASDETHAARGRSAAEAEPAHVSGHHDSQAPHESPKLILVPICILAALALLSGFTNAAPFGESFEKFTEYVEPRSEAVVDGDAAEAGFVAVAPAADEGDGGAASEEAGGEGHAVAAGCGYDAPEAGAVCNFPTISHAEFHWWPNALTSLIIVAVSLAAAWAFCVAFYTKRSRVLVGLTDRVPPLRWGYHFLVNKYYLDALYEGVVVRAVAHPIAKVSNWVNQNVLDGTVNGAGALGRRAGVLVYRRLDQQVVDGAVNASGFIAEQSGEALRPVQSGRVNQYGALLFGAAAIGAIVLVVINV